MRRPFENLQEIVFKLSLRIPRQNGTLRFEIQFAKRNFWLTTMIIFILEILYLHFLQNS